MGLNPLKGSSLVRHSHITTPNEYTSTELLYGCESSSSGAMYGYVPTSVSRFEVGPCALARPKSATLITPLSSSKRFPDLMSRCMMFLECRYTMPLAVSAIQRITCAAVML